MKYRITGSSLDPSKGRMVSVNPYGKRAKELYRHYIEIEGHDPADILPPGFKYHPNSQQIKRLPKPKLRVTERSAYKSYLTSYTLHNRKRVGGLAGFNLLHELTPHLSTALKHHGGIKFHVTVICEMTRQLLDDGIKERKQDFYITSNIRSVTNGSELIPMVNETVTGMQQQVPEKETQGSGWQFQRVLTLELHIAKYKPLAGSSWFDLPSELKAKKAIINIKNTDDQCFKWSILAALFPGGKNAERVSKYTEHESKLDWSGLSFPVQLQGIPAFESKNKLSIHVYGWDKKNEFHLLQKSKLIDTEHHIDLLFMQQGTSSHYCYIKNFSRFARVEADCKHNKKHFCRFCLHGFPSKDKLDKHLSNGCREITEVKPEMPSEDDAQLFFKNADKQYAAPFAIYADFECLTEPVSKAQKNSDQSYTDAYQSHTPCGFCYQVVSSDSTRTFEPEIYRGQNTVQEFIMRMKSTEEELMELIQTNTPMVMTAQDEINFQCAECCCLCKQPLGDDRVRDHDHLTGKFRGAAHSVCNMEEGKARTRRFTIPVFFHNLKGYDGHLIVSEVGKHTANLSAIPQNLEKYISFSFNHFRFLDSAAFLNGSLDMLTKNLYEKGKGKDKFIHSKRHCSKPEHLDMLLQKGVYPYDYMSNWDRFSETKLPPKSKFYSKLSESHISADAHKHGQAVWKAFECKHLGDYHDLYMKTDVLLLADVFENFRQICMESYELDPAHYFTTPNFAWDAMLKKTGVTLELLTDYDMYLMVEQGLRGGIAMITHRHAEANNPQMKDKYDPEKEHSYISYLDANNLYGQAMVQPLPIDGFKWSDERDADALIEQYAGNETAGCIVKCDIEYPEHLHDAHNDYPLAPERKLVTQNMLSPYAANLQQQLGISKDVCEKLVPNLQDKTNYVVDIRNLKFYRDHKLIIKRVHAVITFRQERWILFLMQWIGS